jgi:hypothetical protein
MMSVPKRIVALTALALAALIGATGPTSCGTPYNANVRWTS